AGGRRPGGFLRVFRDRRGRVPGPLLSQALRDEPLQLAVRRARAERRPQIDLALVQQAPAEMAVRGEARPVAGGAERLGHGGDDADLALEGEPVLLERVVHLGGAGSAVVEAARLEAELLLQPGADARGGEHLQLLAPAISLE